jgi:hypothetical protein
MPFFSHFTRDSSGKSSHPAALLLFRFFRFFGFLHNFLLAILIGIGIKMAFKTTAVLILIDYDETICHSIRQSLLNSIRFSFLLFSSFHPFSSFSSFLPHYSFHLLISSQLHIFLLVFWAQFFTFAEFAFSYSTPHFFSSSPADPCPSQSQFLLPQFLLPPVSSSIKPFPFLPRMEK